MQAEGQIRQAQVITTFGPGAMVDLPRHAVLVGGLEHWNRGETIHEPRLCARLMATLELPALELRAPPVEEAEPGQPAEGIKVFQFPEWFLTQQENLELFDVRARLLVHRKALERGRFRSREGKMLRVVPVRFVRACRAGHIGDLDWRGFVHGGRGNGSCGGVRQMWIEERGTTGDLRELVAACECGRERNLIEAAEVSAATLGTCDGARLWLGPHAHEGCRERNRLLIRSASNAYFPELMSVISLPERSEKVRAGVDAAWDFLETAESEADVARERKKTRVREALQGIGDAEVWAEIDARKKGLGKAEKKVKVAELETLLGAEEGLGEDRPDGVFYARALPKEAWQRPWMGPIERVVLVHRLREVVAQAGFTRFEPLSADLEGELELGARRAALAQQTTWLPAYENRGEGVFVQFRAEALRDWQGRPAASRRATALMRGHQLWAKERNGAAVFPGAAYVLLHSVAHLLMTAIALECGYPATSLRERIYALPQLGYGILIYTGGAGAEGTLGGLVEVGRRIAAPMRQALRMAELCSNDPVCAHHDPANPREGRPLHGAACHGCLLVAETSCEHHNDYLDRALVAATVAGLEAELFPRVTEGAG